MRRRLRQPGHCLALGEGVGSIFAVATVCVGAAVEAVVRRAAEQCVVPRVTLEPIIAAHGPNCHGAGEVDVVAEQPVVPAAALQLIVAGVRDSTIRGAVADQNVVRAAAGELVVTRPDRAP
jgi:hypothetical protein